MKALKDAKWIIEIFSDSKGKYWRAVSDSDVGLVSAPNEISVLRGKDSHTQSSGAMLDWETFAKKNGIELYELKK